MAEITNLNKYGITDFNRNSYNSRRIENVQLASGDDFLFFVDQCVDGGELVYDITKSISGSYTKAFASSVTGALPKGLRVLSGCRRTGDVISGAGIKWIGYKNPSVTAVPYKILPFIETYSPSVSYNKQLNQIDLYFWTNLAVSDGETPVYAIENIAVQQEDGVFYYDRSSGDKNIQKVLCHAQGMFIKGSVNGTLLSEADALYPYKESSDYIPVFENPKILHVYSNQDAVISDFSGSVRKYLPFDIRQVFKNESGTLDEKFSVYLPFGFWRRDDTKVLRSSITQTQIYNGSDWFYLPTLNWKDVTAEEIPSSSDFTTKNDFHNLVIQNKCEIWTWLSDKGNSTNEWYLFLSSSSYTEEETGTSYVNFNIGDHTNLVSDADAVKAAMEKGLCIHLATLYKSSDGQVFIHQLYHGIKQDFSGESGFEYLPFDLKIETSTGESPVTYVKTYLPVVGVWIRNGEVIGNVPSTGWHTVSTSPSESFDVWAIIREDTTPPTGSWYEHINSAKLVFEITAIDALPSNSSDYLYGQSMRIGRVTVVSGESGNSFSVQQYYHGIVKDNWKTGSGVLTDSEDNLTRTEGDGNPAASNSIEKYTVSETLEGNTTTAEFIRVVGMDETKDSSGSGNHNISLPEPTEVADISMVLRKDHDIVYVPLTTHTVNKSFDTDGQRVRTYIGSQDETLYPHLANSLVGVTSSNNLNYFPPSSFQSGTDNGTTVNSFEGLVIENNQLVAKFTQVTIPDATESSTGGGGVSGSEGDSVILKSDSGTVEKVCYLATKNGHKVTLHFSDLPANNTVAQQGYDEKYLPFDVAVRNKKLQMFYPVWRRNGMNIGLSNGSLSEGGWLDISSMSGDIYAVLENPVSESSNPVFRANQLDVPYISGDSVLTFDDWYGTAKELEDTYFVSYDDLTSGLAYPYSYLHKEYATVMTGLRSLEYDCVDYSEISTEQISLLSSSLTVGAVSVLNDFCRGFKKIINQFNDSIYDLDVSDLTEDSTFPVYKYSENPSNPGINLYPYYHVFSKSETVTVSGQSMTVKDVLTYFIQRYNYVKNSLYSENAGEGVVLQAFVDSVLTPLQPYAHAIQVYLKTKIDSNLVSLRTEVYKNHLYVLTGSTDHYSLGENIPTSLVQLSGTAFFYNEIQSLKTKIETYISIPTTENENIVLSEMNRLLEGDFTTDTTRSLSVYAIYSVPMLLPYYVNMYPAESLVSLYETRTVKNLSIGDSAQYTVGNEKDYVVALLNKLAYCYTWDLGFYGKKEAIYSVTIDLLDSVNKVTALMQNILSTMPTGTFPEGLGIGGGDTNVYSSSETGTWIKGMNLSLHMEGSLYNRYSYYSNSVLQKNIVKSAIPKSASPNQLGTPITGFVHKLTKGSIENNNFSGLVKNLTNFKPRENLSSAETKSISDLVKNSALSSSIGEDLDDFIDRMATFNVITPDLARSIYDGLVANGTLPSSEVRDAMIANDGGLTLSDYKAYLSYSFEGNGSTVKWVTKPALTTVYRGTTISFGIEASWAKATGETEENPQYGFQNVYIGTFKTVLTPSDAFKTTYDYVTDETKAFFSVTFSWKVPFKDTLASGKTTLGSLTNYLLNAVFYKTSDRFPFSISTSPAFLANTKMSVIKGKSYLSGSFSETGSKEWISSPFSLTSPGYVDFWYSDKDAVYPQWKFKEWQINGSTVSDTETPDGNNFKLRISSLVKSSSVVAVFEKVYVKATLTSVPPEACSFTTAAMTVEAGSPIVLSFNKTEPTTDSAWVFKRWISRKSDGTDLYLFAGNSHSSLLASPTVTLDGNEADVYFDAEFAQENNYDPPSDDSKYRVIVNVTGGDSSCTASMVTSNEALIDTPLDAITSCLEGSYNNFGVWSCPDSGLTISTPDQKGTAITGTENKTYVLTANWTDTSSYNIFITANGLEGADVESKVFSVSVTKISGTVVNADTSEKLTQAVASVNPLLDASVVISVNPPAGYTIDNSQMNTVPWTWGSSFNADALSATNVIVVFKKQAEIKVNTFMTFYESSYPTQPITSVSSVIFPSFVTIKSSEESSSITFIANDYLNPVLVTNDSGEKGYWEYAFSKLDTVANNGATLHSGYFDDENDFETVSLQSTATITRAMFEERNVLGISFEYAAYFTKTWIPEADVPSLTRTVNVTWDSTQVTVSEKKLPSSWTSSTGHLSGTFQLETSLFFSAVICDSSYETDNGTWKLDGVKVGTGATYSMTVRDNVTLSYVPAKTQTAFIYVKTSPTDASVTASVQGDLILNSGNVIPSVSGYPVKAEVAVGKVNGSHVPSFFISHSNSNSNYVFNGIYDVQNNNTLIDATASNPVNVLSSSSRYFNVHYKTVSNKMDITYKIYVTKDGIETVTDGKTCDYASITGPDSESFTKKDTFIANLNDSGDLVASFTKFEFIETQGLTVKDPVTSLDATSYFTFLNETTSLLVKGYFYVTSGTPEPYADDVVNVSVSPAGKGQVTVSLSVPVTGTVTQNSLGNPFDVSHGTVMTLTASETYSSYTFKKFTVTQGTSSSDTLTSSASVTVTSNTSVVAYFENNSDAPTGGTRTNESSDKPETSSDETSDTSGTQESSTVHVATDVSPEGSGTVFPSFADIRKGTVVTTNFTATPVEGYSFVSWSTGDTSNPAKILPGNENFTLTANFESTDKIQPTVEITTVSTSGLYKEEELPWYSPISDVKLLITTTAPSPSQLLNSAALHIAKVSVIDANAATYGILQYFHGERVDYIDYGDADMKNLSSSWKSVIFNDGDGGDTNRKPARLYGFDSTVNIEIPTRNDGNTSDVDWKKYGLLARKTVNAEGNPEDGAELVYLKIPQSNAITADNLSVEKSTLDGGTEEILQLLNFDTGDSVGSGLTQLISADPDSGKISAKDSSRYKILVRIETSDEKGKLGYMPFGNSDGSDPDTESEDNCQHDDFPGGGGTVDEDGNDTSNDGSSRDFPGDDGDNTNRDNNAFPGKTGACW